MKRNILASLLLGALALNAQAGDRIKASKLAEERSRVWAAWCQEVQRTDTLAPFSHNALSEGTHTAWTLPEDLEHAAVMDFYSGVKGEKPEAGYPFFLYLHGSGPRDTEWATGLALAQRFDDAPSMYAVPRIPNEGQLYRWWHKSKQWAWEKLLRRVLTDPRIDASRIYWFGISEGGYGSQRLASFYADYLAAAGPMAGGEPLRNAPAENLSHTPLSFVTGEKDEMFYRNILTPRTKERLDSLELLYPGEYQHRIIMEEGRGHHVTYDLTTPWLKQFRRDAQPHHFRWENYEMDGRKRNAFYNLEVLEESCDERHDYEFTIEDNVIRLDVRQVNYIITERDPRWGIELNNTRTYATAPHGQVRIYLSETLADLSRPVTLYINGNLVGTYRPQLSKATLRRSCELFYDPLRLFPAAIDVKF